MAEIPHSIGAGSLLRRTVRACSLVFLGIVGGVALARFLQLRPRSEAPEDGGLDRWTRAWEEAMEGAAAGLSSARELVLPHPELDLAVLERRLSEVQGTEGCRVRVLSEGIVEVIGTADTDEARQVLLQAAAAEPGVEIVVDRVWTPSSTAPGELA